MVKNVLITLLILALVVLGYYAYYKEIQVPREEAAKAATQIKSEDCPQVVTLAKSPATGAIKDFPTPCAVPEGWEVIENDIPSMDLEVQ